MTNDPLDPAPAPYPSAGTRTSDTAPPVDVDPRSTTADSSTADIERPGYSVDQVGDDQAPPVDSAGTTRNLDSDEPLVPTKESVDFKARWDVIQQGFVDDPRTAV